MDRYKSRYANSDAMPLRSLLRHIACYANSTRTSAFPSLLPLYHTETMSSTPTCGRKRSNESCESVARKFAKKVKEFEKCVEAQATMLEQTRIRGVEIMASETLDERISCIDVECIVRRKGRSNDELFHVSDVIGLSDAPFLAVRALSNTVGTWSPASAFKLDVDKSNAQRRYARVCCMKGMSIKEALRQYRLSQRMQALTDLYAFSDGDTHICPRDIAAPWESLDAIRKRATTIVVPRHYVHLLFNGGESNVPIPKLNAIAKRLIASIGIVRMDHMLHLHRLLTGVDCGLRPATEADAADGAVAQQTASDTVAIATAVHLDEDRLMQRLAELPMDIERLHAELNVERMVYEDRNRYYCILQRHTRLVDGCLYASDAQAVTMRPYGDNDVMFLIRQNGINYRSLRHELHWLGLTRPVTHADVAAFQARRYPSATLLPSLDPRPAASSVFASEALGM